MYDPTNTLSTLNIFIEKDYICNLCLLYIDIYYYIQISQ